MIYIYIYIDIRIANCTSIEKYTSSYYYSLLFSDNLAKDKNSNILYANIESIYITIWCLYLKVEHISNNGNKTVNKDSLGRTLFIKLLTFLVHDICMRHCLNKHLASVFKINPTIPHFCFVT